MYPANVNLNSIVANVTQFKSGITIKVGVSAIIRRKIVCEKDYFLNPAKCTCENGEYLRSTIGGSVITCGEII